LCNIIYKKHPHEDRYKKDLRSTVSRPSELRIWFHQNPDLWDDFAKKYREELDQQDFGKKWMEAHRQQTITTLLYAANNKIHTHATVLQQYLQDLQLTM